jgi:hypothetical protein
MYMKNVQYLFLISLPFLIRDNISYNIMLLIYIQSIMFILINY